MPTISQIKKSRRNMSTKQMVTTYKLIEKLQQLDYFNDLLRRGVIPANWLDYKMIYEYYCAELETLRLDKWKTKSVERQAKHNTAEKFSISERSVYLIIQKMKS